MRQPPLPIPQGNGCWGHCAQCLRPSNGARNLPSGHSQGRPSKGCCGVTFSGGQERSRQRGQCVQRLEVPRGCSRLPILAPGFTLRVLPEGRGGGPRAPYDRPKSNQMGWGPRGAVGPFVTVICPAAEITNTFLSEGLAATGLRVLMPYSCGHNGGGWGARIEGRYREGF